MKRLTIVVAYLSLFWLITGKAGIMANMTRVIYHQGDKERSVLLANTNSYPVIVQNWVDHGEANPQTETPFVVLAPIFIYRRKIKLLGLFIMVIICRLIESQFFG